MKKQSVSFFVITRVLAAVAVVAVTACANTESGFYAADTAATPTVDYVERLDVYSAPHKDSFLNQLAMNYRSYAIYNARTSGFPDVGELFANKAVAAFSGEVPFPESLNNWKVGDEKTAYDLNTAYNEMIKLFQDDASMTKPELAAELQAKYDCWLSATATGQDATAQECRTRFDKTLTALRDCTGGRVVRSAERMESNGVAGPMVSAAVATSNVSVNKTIATGGAAQAVGSYYPETGNMAAMRGANRARDGVVIVNNVNIPEHLIKPEPVQQAQPLVFNQNIYGGDKTINDNSGSNSNNVSNSGNTNIEPADGANGCKCKGQLDGAQLWEPVLVPEEDCECEDEDVEEIRIVGEDLVSRQEFINMMMAMRSELSAINARLDRMKEPQPVEEERTIIKVQQIPVEPKQHVMEEVFEVRFDFNKANIKPEYRDLIKKLVDATQSNKNIKVSVVGHTDTVGSASYNYALGGRRAEAVQKMLIEYGIPASQIVAVSAGEEDLKVPTPDGVANAENRRVRVVKEVSYTEPGGTRMVPVADVSVQEYVDDCEGGDCEM